MAIQTLTEGKAKWEAFVAALGKTPDEIATALESVVGDVTDGAIDLLGNPDDTPDADIKTALAGLKVPTALVNKAIRGIRNAPAPAPAAAPAPAPAAMAPTVRAAEVMLVSAPGDDDLLKALKLGGRPEFEPVNVAAVVRAAVARRNGVFDLPERLVDAIRNESRKQRKPNPPILIQVRRELAKRSNVAAIFADLFPEEGKGGSAYVSEKDKTETLKALDGIWPALIAFQGRLRAFRMEAMTAAMTAGMATQMSGGFGFSAMGLDPSMLMGVNLDTSSYVDDVEGIIDALNGVFMDQGLYASRVLAEEGARLTGILKMDGLVSAVGCTNYEDMLRELRIGVTADVIRGQTDLATWLINVVTLQEKDSASLPGVLLALCMLGDRIPWEKLSAGSVHLEREAPPQFHGTAPMLPQPSQRDTGARGRGGARRDGDDTGHKRY